MFCRALVWPIIGPSSDQENFNHYIRRTQLNRALMDRGRKVYLQVKFCSEKSQISVDTYRDGIA